MITINIEAETIEDLLLKLKTATSGLMQWAPEEQLTAKAPVASTPPQEPQEARPPKKAAKAKPSTNGHQRAPVAPPEPPEEATEAAVDLDQAQIEVDVDDPGMPAGNPVELMKIKNQVMAELQNAFAAGKIKQVRALLAEHGNGAKSFPEVDPAAFPAIKAAVDAGALK